MPDLKTPVPYPIRPLLWLLALLTTLAGLAQIVLRHWGWMVLLLAAGAILATVAGRLHPSLEEQNVLARTEDEGPPNTPE